MFFHVNNLLMLALFVASIVVWLLVAHRRPESFSRNIFNYAVLTFLAGAIVRSFSSQFWALIPLAALVVGVCYVVLRYVFADRVDQRLMLGIAIAGPILGLMVRGGFGLWMTLVVGIAFMVVTALGLVEQWTKRFISTKQ